MTAPQISTLRPTTLSDSKRFMILGFACLLLLAQAVPLLSTRWVADESWYSAPAHRLANYGELRMPAFAHYRTQARVETASPALMVIMAGVFKVLGTSLYVAKLPYLLCALAGILLTYLLGCELDSPLLGLAGAVFLATDNMYFLAARTARPEAMTIFFTMAGLLLYLYGRRRDSLWLTFLSGLVLGIATLVHVNGLAGGIIAGVLAFQEFGLGLVRQRRPWVFLAGMILPAIPFLLWATSDEVHRWEFYTLYSTGEQHTISEIPSVEAWRYSDFIGMPSTRFRMRIPIPYRLHVAIALLGAAVLLFRLNRPLLGKIATFLLPTMLWWAYVRNANVRYTATAGPYFALLLAGAAIAAWNYRPSWRKMTLALASLLLVAQIGSNYALLYLYRKADFGQLTRTFQQTIPPDATVYGALTFWMAFPYQPYYSYSRTPLQYALDRGASYLVLNDNLMLHGNGWGEDDWHGVRAETGEFIRNKQATLVARVPNDYYGNLEIYRVNNPKPQTGW